MLCGTTESMTRVGSGFVEAMHTAISPIAEKGRTCSYAPSANNSDHVQPPT